MQGQLAAHQIVVLEVAPTFLQPMPVAIGAEDADAGSGVQVMVPRSKGSMAAVVGHSR